jgi:hypothetical protein
MSGIAPEQLEILWIRLDQAEDAPAAKRELIAERLYHQLTSSLTG